MIEEGGGSVSGLLRTIGLACFTAGLLFAESHTSRVVAGRWSWSFVGVISTAALMAVGSAILAISRRRRGDGSDPPLSLASRASLDTAVFFWGVAYLVSAWLAPSNAGRILDLAVFGAVHPLPSLLEWLAMVFAFAGLALAAARIARGRWVEVGLTAGATVAVLVLAEGAARVKVAVAPAVDGFPTYSTKAWMERFAELDADGFRNSPSSFGSQGDARRLVVVGDSVAFGWGIRKTQDRFSEVLAALLSRHSGSRWESLTLARPDTGTLDHLRFLERASTQPPDAIVLLYIFNDIDYLRAATPRTGWGRLHPVGLLFRNSYLFQEIYLRMRALGIAGPERPPDPYFDAETLSRHLDDVRKWVDRAQATGAVVLVVPFDAGVTAEPELVRRYETFYRSAQEAGLPLCSLARAFDGRSFDEVTVNSFDRHPNELAHRLGADVAAACLEPLLPSRASAR